MEAEYYQKKYLSLENLLKSKSPVLLSTLTNKISDGTHFTPSYTENGVPFLSALNVLENSLSLEAGHRFISSEEHDNLYRRCDPQPGDVLLRKVGVGPRWAAVVPEGLPVFSIFVSVALLRPRTELIAPEVLATFINSESGQTQLLRVQKGASQPDLHLEDIRDVFIPLFGQEFQNRIVELHQNSVEVSSKGIASYKNAETLLLNALNLATYTPTTKNTNIKSFKESFVASGRMDAEYYQPMFDEIEELIKSNGEYFKRVEEIQTYNSRGMAAIYDETGTVDMITQKHILEAGLNYDNFDKTNIKHFSTEETSFVAENDILIYGTGANIGRAQPYLSEKKAVACQDIIILRVIEDPVYVAFVINSFIGRLQTEKMRTGSAQPHLYPKDVAQVLIPFVAKDTQLKIREKIISSLALKKQSTALLETAKRAVEIAIEQDEQAAISFLETAAADGKNHLRDAFAEG
ncbi:restriction endonuclease subunit S domain-containing protein [Geotalea uraniireducens]|nr:hypothetical protein [Geotalea uraniireducens]